MSENKGTLLSLWAAGAVSNQRVQHPKVHERKDRGTYYWFFRYYHDELLPDGAVKTSRKFHVNGPSRGAERLRRKADEIERDKYLGTINSAPTKPEAVVEI